VIRERVDERRAGPMDNITMNLIPESWAALVPSADCIGDATGVFIDRGRTLAAEPKTPFVVDPRPAGPPV
jgi:hypothetical protein